MKKLLILALLSAFSTSAIASPDIFDKIGKALNKADKAISKVTGTTQNKTSSKQNATDGQNHKKPAPNVDINITKASRYSDGVLIPYILTNNGEEQYNGFIFNLRDVCGGNGKGERATITFDNGKEYYITEEYSRHDYHLPGESKRNGYLYVTKFPKGATSIKQIRLGGKAEGGPQERYNNNRFGEWLYTFDNVPLVNFQTSNQEGVYSTHPDVRVYFNSAEYNETTKALTLDYTLTNTGDDDFVFYLGGDAEANDEFGNIYKGYSKIAGGDTKLVLDSEKTVRIITTINNVPRKTKKFSSITAPFRIPNTPDLATKFIDFEFE